MTRIIAIASIAAAALVGCYPTGSPASPLLTPSGNIDPTNGSITPPIDPTNPPPLVLDPTVDPTR